MTIAQILTIAQWFSSYSYETCASLFDEYTLIDLFKLLPSENEIPLEHKSNYEWMKDKVNDFKTEIENNK
jgi:hypothetical protein